MAKKLTNLDIQEFLKDYKTNVETTILEEGSKEKVELEKIAEARGIKLKGSRDLAVFKTIYAFTDKPNSNGAILPKKELLRVLPQIVGKPVNVNHSRRDVVGSYIDYRYKQKGGQVITYGTFFKSNFPEEFEKAQKLLKKKKLSSSFEIWSPKDKRKYREDGSFEMYQMEIAGGALIYEDDENEPAFKDAKVLSIAKDRKESKLELVYASKHKEDELITSAEETVVKEKKEKGGLKTETMENETKITNTPAEAPKEIAKITCSNCSEEFEPNGTDVKVKCPKCFAILNREGTMIYPPQIKDFKLLCPSCKVGRWLILSRKDDGARLQCSQCSKQYDVEFEKTKDNTLINKISFVYTSSVNCPQCGRHIDLIRPSGIETSKIKCKKCGLEFSHNLTHERYKRISKIEEVIPNKNKIDSKKESSEEGGKKMAKEKKVEKASEKKIEDKKEVKIEPKKEVEVKEEKKVEVKKEETVEVKETPKKVEPKVEEKKEEAKETPKTEKVEEPKVEAKPEVKKEEKIEEKKVEVKEEKAEVKPEAKTEETPKAEEPKVEKAEEVVEKYPKSKHIRKVLKENKTALQNATHSKELVKKAVKKLREQKKQVKLETAKEDTFKAGIKKMVKLYLAEKAKVKLYKDNAKTIIERRAELGETELTDTDILNDDKFGKAKAEKENLILKAGKEKTDELVGSKKKDDGYYSKKRKAIDNYAFGKVNKTHKENK